MYGDRQVGRLVLDLGERSLWEWTISGLKPKVVKGAVWLYSNINRTIEVLS